MITGFWAPFPAATEQKPATNNRHGVLDIGDDVTAAGKPWGRAWIFMIPSAGIDRLRER